jgi:hypothetical protein
MFSAIPLCPPIVKGMPGRKLERTRAFHFRIHTHLGRSLFAPNPSDESALAHLVSRHSIDGGLIETAFSDRPPPLSDLERAACAQAFFCRRRDSRLKGLQRRAVSPNEGRRALLAADSVQEAKLDLSQRLLRQLGQSDDPPVAGS